MPHNEKEWNPRFIAYMNMIVNHPNYKGLPIKIKSDGKPGWVATAKSEIGQGRIEWCLKKADELGFPRRAGVYADVMLEIHPTKWKVCQTCGRSMSLYYHYPNVNFLKSLNREFNSDYTECDHISDIWDDLINHGIPKEKVASFLIEKSGLDLDPEVADKDEIINAMEILCRKGGKKLLGPGAMSNFPDRFDGFHSYNRCCRAVEDQGRSKENLKSYTKDRRAYEYWSDGNIHAADQFMGSDFFKGTSADHIGPISLGFVHDPRYLQPMPSGDNSSKRDRLQIEDIEKIIETYKRTGIYPMSWYSKMIWEYILDNYEAHPELVPSVYRDALKQNMSNFMYVLWAILQNAPINGEHFLEEALIAPKYVYFEYTYEFNELGEITVYNPRHYTGRNQNENDRLRRISIDSVYDYNEKDNRHLKPDLNNAEMKKLKELCNHIETGVDCETCKLELIALIENIETRIIEGL